MLFLKIFLQGWVRRGGEDERSAFKALAGNQLVFDQGRVLMNERNACKKGRAAEKFEGSDVNW